jgi:hypothetical protein
MQMQMQMQISCLSVLSQYCHRLASEGRIWRGSSGQLEIVRLEGCSLDKIGDDFLSDLMQDLGHRIRNLYLASTASPASSQHQYHSFSPSLHHHKLKN